MHRFFDRGLAYAQKRGYPKFSTGGKGTVEVVNNLEWTQGLGMLDFLRTVGKVARVNIMLSRDRRVRPLSRVPRDRPMHEAGTLLMQAVSGTGSAQTRASHSPNSATSCSRHTTFTTSTSNTGAQSSWAGRTNGATSWPVST